MRATSLALVALTLALVGPPAAAQETAQAFVGDTPDAARDSISAALRAGVRSPEGASAAWDEARSLAQTYATVWGDSFPLRRVDWVTALPVAARRSYLRADSLVRLGNERLFREGPARARASWRGAVGLFEEIGDSAGLAAITGNLGAAYYEEGRLDSATAYLERALETAARFGDRRSAGNAATILGNIAWERGELRTAMQLNLRAADLHRDAANFSGMAADHNNAGLIAEALGDLESARVHYGRALEISRGRLDGERAADYLVNLGGLAARRLAIDEARGRYERALDLYREAGEVVNQALVHRNLGTLEAGVSSYEAAIAEYGRALELYLRVHDIRGEVEVRRLLASVFAAVGRPDEALEELAQAEARHAMEPWRDPALGAALSVVRGDVELTLNRTEEARASFDAAERLYRVLGDMAGLAAAVQGRAQLELEASHHHQVTRELRPVAAVQPAGRERGWSNLLLGVAYGQAAEADSARATLAAAHEDFERAGDQAGVAVALGALAQVEVENERPLRALRLLDEARAHGRGLPAIEWWLYHQTGRALEAVRDLDGAAAHYDSAIGMIEGLADWVRFDDRRAMYLEDKWESYAALARLHARRGETASALAVSERLRARYLLDQLARRRDATRLEGTLRSRERRLSRRIGELTAMLRVRDEGHRGPTSIGTDEVREELLADEVREELLATQAAYRRLVDRMRAEEPDYVRALRGETVRLDAIQEALKADELLVEYLVADDQLWIFAISDQAVAQTSMAVGRAALRAQIDFARWALETQPDREELWRGALKGLDDVLLDPIRRTGMMAERRTLIIVPHLELHYLPFESLIEEGRMQDRFLIEEHDVVYVPSASVWLRLLERPAQARTGVLGLAPMDDELAGTVSEVDAIRSAWGDAATIKMGASATEGVVRGSTGHRLVHLATRGVLNRHNPLFSYVQLSPDGHQDGRLEVHEVFRLGLRTDLMVLSACQTALGSGSVGDVPAGDDWVGLVRAFLHAGADNVLATLWAVEDLRTAEFVASFHRRLAEGGSYVDALAEAKREAIRSDELGHPYFWAGFVLTGAPRN